MVSQGGAESAPDPACSRLAVSTSGAPGVGKEAPSPSNMLERQKTFKADSNTVREQLRKHEHCIINPRTNKYIVYWDTVTFLALMFTAVLTPWEVCLIKSTPSWRWVLANWIVNSIFIIDMVVQFFLAYQETTKKGGRWVTDRKLIVKHYLYGWFWIDLVSVVDFNAIGMAVVSASGGSEEASESTNLLRLVRIIRLVRLIKLLRILRASRIISRWKDYVGLSFAQVTMIEFVTMTVFLVHMMACLWAYIGINWQPTNGTTLDFETTWIQFYGFDEYEERGDLMRVYNIALFTSIVAMFGGVGSITPQNYAEYGVLSVMMLFGSFVWAYVIASFCGILSTLNPHRAEFRNMMDNLNMFMSEHSFEKMHAVRLREFFRQTQDYQRHASYEDLFEKMSAQLRGDTALAVGQDILNAVWYLRIGNEDKDQRIEREYLAVIALNMGVSVYEAQEMVPTEDLTIITKGMVALKLHILGKGAVLGIDCIILDQHAGLRDKAKGNCVSFVQTATISRAMLFELMEPFPKATAVLMKASRRLTLRAGLRRSVKMLKDHWQRHGYKSSKKDKGSLARLILQLAQEEKPDAFVESHRVHEVEADAGHRRTSAAETYIDLMHSKGYAARKEIAGGSVIERRKSEFPAESPVGGDALQETLRKQGELLLQVVSRQSKVEQALEMQLTMLQQIMPTGYKVPAANMFNDDDSPAETSQARPRTSTARNTKGVFGGMASRRSVRASPDTSFVQEAAGIEEEAPAPSPKAKSLHGQGTATHALRVGGDATVFAHAVASSGSGATKWKNNISLSC